MQTFSINYHISPSPPAYQPILGWSRQNKLEEWKACLRQYTHTQNSYRSQFNNRILTQSTSFSLTQCGKMQTFSVNYQKSPSLPANQPILRWSRQNKLEDGWDKYTNTAYTPWQGDLRLQVTELLGAEGKDHLVFLNSGAVKRFLMGSLAGPESPNPWSHRIKLRAIGSGLLGKTGLCGRGSTTKRTVKATVTVNRIAGFRKSVNLDFIFGFSCWCPSLPSYLVHFFFSFKNLGSYHDHFPGEEINKKISK